MNNDVSQPKNIQAKKVGKKIQVARDGEVSWEIIRNRASEENKAYLNARELDSRMRIPIMGDEHTPQLLEVQLLPDTEVKVHCHEGDEIIYVVDGEIWVNNTVLPKNSSILVRGNTLYGFRSGPSGVRFVNFRPHCDMSYITPSQYKPKSPS